MASSTPPMAPQPAQPVAGAPAPKKGTSPLVWILAGCGGLILIAAIVMLVGGYFVAHKFKGYAEMAKKNPTMAAAKMAMAFNPDVEIVSEDDDRGILTIRNKKTGEEITMNAEDIKKGRLKFKNEKGEEVTFEGSTERGKEGFTVKSKEGTMAFGNAQAQAMPGWVPSYPGVTPMASVSKSTAAGLYGSYSFQTSDKTGEVLDFFEKELKDARFSVERTNVSGGAMAMGTIHAKRDGGKREVNVSVIPTGEVAQVTVQYTTTHGVRN